MTKLQAARPRLDS